LQSELKESPFPPRRAGFPKIQALFEQVGRGLKFALTAKPDNLPVNLLSTNCAGCTLNFKAPGSGV
jgi:hypothetical protein